MLCRILSKVNQCDVNAVYYYDCFNGFKHSQGKLHTPQSKQQQEKNDEGDAFK